VTPEGEPSLTLAEVRQQLVSALRLEHRRGTRRLLTDAWVQRGGYAVPAGEDGSADVLVVDSETQARLGFTADDQMRNCRLQARAYGQLLNRASRF
jgi:hypothetical protein